MEHALEHRPPRARGYVVVATDFHGSRLRQKFKEEISGEWGGLDYGRRHARTDAALKTAKRGRRQLRRRRFLWRRYDQWTPDTPTLSAWCTTTASRPGERVRPTDELARVGVPRALLGQPGPVTEFQAPANT